MMVVSVIFSLIRHNIFMQCGNFLEIKNIYCKYKGNYSGCAPYFVFYFE